MLEEKKWFPRFARATLAVLVLMASASGISAQVFSPPKAFPNTFPSGSWILDAAGNLNVLTLQGTSPTADLLFSRSTDGGATFSAPVNVSNDGHVVGPAQVAVDSSGNINVIWGDNSPGNSFLFFSRSTDGGKTFTNPVNVSRNPAGAIYLALDAAGNIYVVWYGGSPSGMYFSQSKDGGAIFSLPVYAAAAPPFAASQAAVDSGGNIDVFWGGTLSPGFAQSSDGGATFKLGGFGYEVESRVYPQMAVDSKGNVNALLLNPYPPLLLFFRSNNGGGAFSTTRFGYCGGPPCSGPTSAKIALDSKDNIDLIWSLAAGVSFLSRSIDGGATFVTSPLPAINTNAVTGIGLDAADNINLIFPGVGNSLLFSRSTNAGGTFSVPENISNVPAGNPQLAVDHKGNVNITWTEGTYPNFTSFFSRGVLLTSLVPQPSTVTGGNSSTGTVSISGPTYTDVNVTLSSSDSSVAKVPPAVAIPAGSTSASFSITTMPVSTTKSITLSASDGPDSVVATLTVLPPALASFSVNPATVVGDSTATGTVTLTGPALSGGALVALSGSNSTVAKVPPSITIPAGATSATFTVKTNIVQSPTAVTLSASYSGMTKTVALTVNPKHAK